MTEHGEIRHVPLEQASDAALVGRAVDGDSRAFAVLVRRYSRLLRGYAYRVLGSSASTDDVVQDALVLAWQQLPALDDGAAFKGWAVRITTRKALDHVRAQRPTDDIDDHDAAVADGPGPEDLARSGELSSSLETALRTLPEGQRRTWVLRELGGHSYDEIAHELDLPVSTVRGLLSRARRTLVQQMNGWR